VVEARECSFRYDRQAPLVLHDASASLHAGRIHAFLGGNGCGKTTLLKLLAGICKPQRGKVRAAASLRRAYLPQDPKALFACDSVAEELHEWHNRFGYTADRERQVLSRFGLDEMPDRHPYDLSGGQQQQLALAKLLLTDPDVLFLDEPTKGLDALSAAQVTRVVRSLADDGAAIAVATHDTAFVRVVADEVSLVFDGMVACTLSADEFFASSLVYSPSAPSRLYGALS
jgi:energy-coupling factor transport system ATP-binding protein